MSAKLNIRAITQKPDLQVGWTAHEVEGGYTVEYEGIVLCTVNGGKPRIFRSLDTVLKSLKEKGITEFEVVAKHAA